MSQLICELTVTLEAGRQCGIEFLALESTFYDNNRIPFICLHKQLQADLFEI